MFIGMESFSLPAFCLFLLLVLTGYLCSTCLYV